jgi:hypothetical protein
MAGFVFIFLQFPDESRSYAESSFDYLTKSTERILNAPKQEAPAASGFAKFRGFFNISPHLMAIQLFSPTEGTLYLASRDRKLYSEAPRGTNKARLSSDDDKFILFRQPLSYAESPLYLEALYRKTLPAERINQLFILLVLSSVSFVVLMGLQFFNPQVKASPGEEENLAKEAETLHAKAVPADTEQIKSPVSRVNVSRDSEELLRKLPATPKVTPPTDQDINDEQPCDPPQLYSPSGLVWERFLIDKLNQELNRAASFDHDLTLGLLEGPSDLSRTHLARQLLKAFRYKDLLFEYGEEGAAVILPNLDLDTAASRFEEFEAELARTVSQGFRFKAGISSRSGRLLTGERLFKESVSALKRSKADKSNATVLFRVDPKKFRQVVSEKSF